MEVFIKVEHPIIYSAEMVRAYLDDRKTMTRRIIGLKQFNANPDNWLIVRHEEGTIWKFTHYTSADYLVNCPYGQVGDKLWVRETWGIGCLTTNQEAYIFYKASGIDYHKTSPWNDWLAERWDEDNWDRWRSGRFMPRWVSRLTQTITEIRAERLQEITDYDAHAEGFISTCKEGEGLYLAQMNFARYWDSLNAKRGYSWESNPWVWVISYPRHSDEKTI